MRRLLLPVAVAGLTVAGCGTDPQERFELRTPPEHTAAEPLPDIKAARAAADRAARIRPTQRDVKRSAPVLRGWAAAVRRSDYERAARYFAVPVIVAQSQPVKFETPGQIKAFNAALPCGSRLRQLRLDGRYIVGTFRLTRRRARQCADAGELVRVAFVLRDGKITEFRVVPDVPGAEPGPERPDGAAPLPPENVS